MKHLLMLMLLAMLDASATAQTDTPSVPLDEPPPAQAPAQPATPAPAIRSRSGAALPTTPPAATPTRRPATAAKKRVNGKRQATPAVPAAPNAASQGQTTRRRPAPADALTPALPPLDGAPEAQAPAPAQAQAPAQAPDAARTEAAQADAAIPQNFKLDVRLERIRLQRSRTFFRSPAETDPGEEAQWSSEMTMQVKVNPPKNWDVIAIDQAAIQQVIDQSGRPLPDVRQSGSLDPTSPAPDLSPMEPLFRKTADGALLLLRMSPPPAGTQSFKTLDALIRARLGFRKDIAVQDLRAQVGQNFLRSAGLGDLVMQVSDVGKDFVEVIALGALDRVGPMTFTDGAGKKLNPYNTEVVEREARTAGASQARVWRFSFSQLPPKVVMNLALYRIVSTRNMTVKFTNVPMP